MYNDTVKFKHLEGNTENWVGWSRSHIGGYAPILDRDGNLHSITVYTSIIVIDPISGKTINKTFSLNAEQADKFIDWFHE